MDAHPFQVLLVDDDEDSYVITRDLLARVIGAPIHLQWADTYEIGLEAMLRGEHAAYMVDYRLGAHNGLELMRAARAGGCSAPIIIMTGQEDHEIDVQAMEEGAADYVIKGQATGDDIERSIRYAIQRSDAERQRLKDQAQLQMLAEQMPAVLWTTDLQLRITSNWGAGLKGLTLHPHELVGKTLFQYLRTDNPEHESILPHLRALKGESVSFEVEWVGRIYRAQVNPLRANSGHIVGTVGTALDVTYANQIEDEFRAAHRIQEQMLPKQVPSIPGYDIAGICHPTAATGGDYYDFIPMPCGALGIVIADVSRHGFASALIMAASKRVIRTLIERGISIEEALTIANRAIAEDTNSEYFVTLFFVCFEPKTSRFIYAGAGHEAYIIDAAAPPCRLVSTSLPLGVHDAEIGACTSSIPLAPGQMLLLFTDGYNEARTPEGRQFGISKVLKTVQAHRHRPAVEIIKALDDAVRDFCHPGVPNDDLTIVILKVDEQH